jgi:plastocyanin
MNRSYPIILICMVFTAVFCAGCTTQTDSGITPTPTTVPSTTAVPTSTSLQVPTTIVTTRIPGTMNTPVATPSNGIATPTTAPGGPSASPVEVQVERVKITAKNFAFDRPAITVPAGSRVIVEFENKDRVAHNMAFYTTPSLSTTIYRGELLSGPGTITYTFIAPATPGTYYFRCDPHPDMNGQFMVT